MVLVMGVLRMFEMCGGSQYSIIIYSIFLIIRGGEGSFSRTLHLTKFFFFLRFAFCFSFTFSTKFETLVSFSNHILTQN